MKKKMKQRQDIEKNINNHKNIDDIRKGRNIFRGRKY